MGFFLLFIDYLIHSIKWINLLIFLFFSLVFFIAFKLFKWFSFKSIKPKKGIYLFSGKPGAGMSCHCMPNNFEKESEADENKPTEERAKVDTDK